MKPSMTGGKIKIQYANCKLIVQMFGKDGLGTVPYGSFKRRLCQYGFGIWEDNLPHSDSSDEGAWPYDGEEDGCWGLTDEDMDEDAFHAGSGFDHDDDDDDDDYENDMEEEGEEDVSSSSGWETAEEEDLMEA